MVEHLTILLRNRVEMLGRQLPPMGGLSLFPCHGVGVAPLRPIGLSRFLFSSVTSLLPACRLPMRQFPSLRFQRQKRFCVC